jgi:Negative regulator of sigma F
MAANGHKGEFDRDLERWAATRSDVPVSPEAGTRIRDALAASLVPVKPIPSAKGLPLILFLVFVLCAGGLIAIDDKSGFHLMTGRQVLAMAAIFVAGGVIFSISLACCMVPGSQRSLPAGVGLTFWGIGILGGIALLFPWRNAAAFVSEGWPCAAMELIVALGSTALFWLLARRGALFPNADLGVALAGLASAVGLVVLQFRCMFQNAPHLLVWHVWTAIALIAAGALIGDFRRARPS